MNFDGSIPEDGVEDTPSVAQKSDPYGEGREIKRTTSICPHCLEPVEAQVFERDGEVWMDKRCVSHGRFSALLSSDVRLYI